MKSCFILAALGMHPFFMGCMNSPTLEKSLHGWTSDGHRLSFHLVEAMKSKPWDKVRPGSSAIEPLDMAIEAILKGDYTGAISKLEAIESREPGSYYTASNLGTAHELNGDNVKALHWIKKGIEINPASHHGSEWLHALILKAKLAPSKDTTVVDTQRLLVLPEEMEKSTPITIQGQERTAGEVFDALSFQLGERMVFVKPKDRWVAECLFSAALLQASFYSVEDGLRLLSLAEEYGFPDAAALSTQRNRFQRSLWMGEVQYWALLVGGGAAGIWLILTVVRKVRDLTSE